MKALINRIIEFSNVDGPGNRLAIFFQACPFHCLYCHNPETLRVCNNCGDCLEHCPTKALTRQGALVDYDEKLCEHCDQCIKACQYFSDPRARQYELGEVLAIISDNKDYIRGITVSGGEPMMYADYLIALFKEVQKLGLSCLIDSNGYYDFSDKPELLECCDGVMLDVKASDENFHFQLCGQSNKEVLKNLDWLLAESKLYEVRTVLLPGQMFHNKATLAYVIEKTANKCRYKLIKYRPYGVSATGRAAFGDNELSDEEFSELVEYAKALNAKNLVLI